MRKNNVPPMEGRIVGYKGILETSGGIWTREFRYELPRKGTPGKWMRISGPPVLCNFGFHIAWPQSASNIDSWIMLGYGPVSLVRVELGGEFVGDSDKRAYEFCRVLKVVIGYGAVTRDTSSKFDIKLLRKLIREDKKSIRDGAGTGKTPG